MVRNLWILSPGAGARQSVTLAIAWLHGCLGIYFWIRAKQWFARYAMLLYTLALLVPVLALLGFAEAGKELASDPTGFGAPSAPSPAGDHLADIGFALNAIFASLIGAVLAGRGLRLYRTFATRIRVTYPGHRMRARSRWGSAFWKAAASASVPHQSVCGGRGRCSTCRVRVIAGLSRSPPGEQSSPPCRGSRPGRISGLHASCGRLIIFSVVPILTDARSEILDRVGDNHVTRGREHELRFCFAT